MANDRNIVLKKNILMSAVLKMVVMRESYLFRLDQMNLFFYMITAVISAAFFLYATALMLTRSTEGEDVRHAA